MKIDRLAGALVCLLVMLAAVLLFPAAAPAILVFTLLLSLGVSSFSVVRIQIRMLRAGRISGGRFVFNSLIEITGTLIALSLSVRIARWAAAYLIARVGGMPGYILGILAALLVGAGLTLLVQWTWSRLTGHASRA